MSEGEEEPAVARARARTYPINSRRLTKDLVGRVAVALDLPTGGGDSTDDRGEAGGDGSGATKRASYSDGNGRGRGR